MKRVRPVDAAPEKDSLLVIGLMSGMSADGVDLALTKIEGTFPDLKVELVASAYRPYEEALKARVRRAQDGRTGDVSRLNVIVAREFAACVNDFLAKTGRSADDIDLIGSHGQTVFHSTAADDETPSSLQVGSPSIIAELTGVPTIGNFRVRDIAVGGQGAPLVCLGDFVLFRRPDGVVILNNLGSISVVSVVTERIDDLLAFDTGPANMAIDFFARRIPRNTDGIDRSGAISARGEVVPKLLDELMASPFFDRPPPKAAGYAEFGPERLATLAARFAEHAIEDLVRTAVEFAAVTLADAYGKFVLPRFPHPKRVLFSGGGVHNQTLMRRIRELLPNLDIEVFEDEFANAKEAVCFAILAHQAWHGRAGNVMAATGARKPVVLGEFAF